MLNDISATFGGFHDDSPKIFKTYAIIYNSSHPTIPLGDYEMEVQVIWEDDVLTSSVVIVHVVDPVPTSLPVPGKKI